MRFLKFAFVLVLCVCLNSVSAQYMTTDDQDKIERLEEMAKNYYEQNNLPKAGEVFHLVAVTYYNYGITNKAIENFNKVLEIYLKLNKLEEVKNTYSNIALAYGDIDELELMCQNFEKSLEIRRAIGDQSEIASGLIDVAFGQKAITHYDDAISNLNEALKIATENQKTSLVIECYKQLADNYKRTGNMKLAQEMQNKAETYSSYTSKEAVQREYEKRVMKGQEEIAQKDASIEDLTQQQLTYMLENERRKRKEDSINNALRQTRDSLFLSQANDKLNESRVAELEKEKELQNEKLKQKEEKERTQRIYIYIAIGVLILVSISALFLIRANRIRKRNNIKLAQQNDEIIKKGNELNEALKKIEHQNQSITQSINYAKGIQQALLRKQDTLNNYIKDAFIFFHPRDIVSGDFYWFNEICINPEKTLETAEPCDKRFVITAVDCTGHGVPGAFMSMIGFNLLNAITSSGVSHADEILAKLHVGVQETLKQKETMNQDGMDMALCVIDPNTNTLEFSGAKNPLVYIQGEELNVIKGSNDGIGGKDDDVHFTNQTVTIDQPTWFYIFSDGYIDQFGGELGRKFMISNFKKYLMQIHNEPAEKQREMLKQNLIDWRGTKYNQLDDVMVIGFKLG